MTINIDEELKKYESNYYTIAYKIFFNSDAGKWMGLVRIIRKDTKEVVRGGFRVVVLERHLVEEKMLDKINTQLINDLELLGIPYEWNSPIRPILVRCLKFRSFITKFGRLYDDAIAGKITKDAFTTQYVIFWKKIVAETLALTRSIEKLSEQERIDMLISPDFVFDDPSDAWSLDDLDARDDILKFYLNPSEAEINAHDTNILKMNNRFHELGWDNPQQLGSE